jgi:hypothetical protein
MKGIKARVLRYLLMWRRMLLAECLLMITREAELR